MNEQHRVILSLAALKDGWALLAKTDPGEFLDQVRAELVDLRVKVQRTYCAFCGKEYKIDSTDAAAIQEHIYVCPEHPLPKTIAQRDRLLAAAKEMLACHAEGGYVQPDPDVLESLEAAVKEAEHDK